jgi:uncharacterized membrane protein YvbJ
MQEPLKFCTHCGQQNGLSAQFCQRCGARYERESRLVTESNRRSETTSLGSKGTRRKISYGQNGY